MSLAFPIIFPNSNQHREVGLLSSPSTNVYLDLRIGHLLDRILRDLFGHSLLYHLGHRSEILLVDLLHNLLLLHRVFRSYRSLVVLYLGLARSLGYLEETIGVF